MAKTLDEEFHGHKCTRAYRYAESNALALVLAICNTESPIAREPDDWLNEAERRIRDERESRL